MIRVKCPKPNCHNHTQVNEIFIGRPVRCSKCGTSFIIKNPSPVPRPAPSPAAPLPLAALAETAPASLTGPPALENLAFTSEPISVPEWAEIEVAATEFTEEGAFTGQAGTKPTEAEVTKSGAWSAPPLRENFVPEPLSEEIETTEAFLAVGAGASEGPEAEAARDAADAEDRNEIRPADANRRETERGEHNDGF